MSRIFFWWNNHQNLFEEQLGLEETKLFFKISFKNNLVSLSVPNQKFSIFCSSIHDIQIQTQSIEEQTRNETFMLKSNTTTLANWTPAPLFFLASLTHVNSLKLLCLLFRAWPAPPLQRVCSHPEPAVQPQSPSAAPPAFSNPDAALDPARTHSSCSGCVSENAGCAFLPMNVDFFCNCLFSLAEIIIHLVTKDGI